MSRGKRDTGASLNLASALYVADNYMRMADRAVKDLSSVGSAGSGQDKLGPVCLAISSFAFALEIYFKTIIFVVEGRAVQGHDLEHLWKKLPHATSKWIEINFDRNHASTGKDWNVLLMRSPYATTNSEARVVVPGASARDIVYGHRSAFTFGRYGYEEPPTLKGVPHNIPGLQLLCWLVRALACHLVSELRVASATKKEGGGEHGVSLSLPSGPVTRFPAD
jgi:hypothetical protein